MTADPRLAAARAFLASSGAHLLDGEADQLRRHLVHVLDVIDEGAGDDDAAAGLGAEVAGAIDAALDCGRRMAEVRAVLDAFDWEADDRQYALEKIDRIVAGGEL